MTTASEKPSERDIEGAKTKSLCRHKQRFRHELQYTIAELSRYLLAMAFKFERLSTLNFDKKAHQLPVVDLQRENS